MSNRMGCCCPTGTNCLTGTPAPYNAYPFIGPPTLTASLAGVSLCTGDIRHAPQLGTLWRLKYISGSIPSGSQTINSNCFTAGTSPAAFCHWCAYGLAHDLVYHIYDWTDTGYTSQLGYTVPDSTEPGLNRAWMYYDIGTFGPGGTPQVNIAANLRTRLYLTSNGFNQLFSFNIFPQVTRNLDLTETAAAPNITLANGVTDCSGNTGSPYNRVGYDGSMTISP